MTIAFREVGVLDRNAEALGVPTATLMENAGRAVADRVAQLAEGGRVVVLAGPGNNGGDGLVAARHLSDAGVPVTVATPVRAGAFRTELARSAWARLPAGVDVVEDADGDAVADALEGAAVVVDALLGAGLRGALRPPYRAYVAAANGAADAAGAGGPVVVSVDAPTGLGTDQCVRPAETVTFHDVKEGMTEDNSGAIRVVDIGIPAEAATHTGPGEFLLYPEAARSQHKGQGGFVLVIGGGPYHGAPAMCGLAAMRTGADLAIVLTPARAADAVASASPNLVVRPLEHDDLDFTHPKNRVTLNLWLKKAHSVVIGPGLGRFNVTRQSIHHAIERIHHEGVPVVVDADALWAMGDSPEVLDERAVVTPHAREFQDLTGESPPSDPEGRGEAARRFSRKAGATVLLKGPVDVIATGERVKYNATGTPAMSVGGTGDVLAGIVAALLAKGLSPFDAARLGAYISGRAGEAAFAERSYGMMASDVMEAVPRVLRDHLG